MHHSYQRQQGISFIEVMIGMVLGLIILGGMMTVYVAGKQSYSDGEQLAMMDTSARNAINILSRHLEHAGYTSITGIPISDYVLPPNYTITGSNISTNSNVEKTVNGSGSNSDTVGIRFRADTRLYSDCLEIPLKKLEDRLCTGLAPEEKCSNTADTLIYNSFKVKNSTDKNSVGSYIPNLYCYSSFSSGLGVVEGIENMQLLYGIDTNTDKVADRYINADTLSAESLWGRIISIQVALLVRSRDPFYSKAQAESFRLLDTEVSTNDRYRRAVYKTVIRLRNLEG